MIPIFSSKTCKTCLPNLVETRTVSPGLCSLFINRERSLYFFLPWIVSIKKTFSSSTQLKLGESALHELVFAWIRDEANRAMCCGQLDRVQVEKRVPFGPTVCKSHLASGIAPGPGPSAPTYVILSSFRSIHDVIWKLTRFRVKYRVADMNHSYKTLPLIYRRLKYISRNCETSDEYSSPRYLHDANYTSYVQVTSRGPRIDDFIRRIKQRVWLVRAARCFIVSGISN